MRQDVRHAPRCAAGMDDLTRLHRVSRIFLARLLMVYGTEAGDFLRRMAAELDELAGYLADDETVPVLGSEFQN
jgi:hypothetical protein